MKKKLLLILLAPTALFAKLSENRFDIGIEAKSYISQFYKNTRYKGYYGLHAYYERTKPHSLYYGIEGSLTTNSHINYLNPNLRFGWAYETKDRPSELNFIYAHYEAHIFAPVFLGFNHFSSWQTLGLGTKTIWTLCNMNEISLESHLSTMIHSNFKFARKEVKHRRHGGFHSYVGITLRKYLDSDRKRSISLTPFFKLNCMKTKIEEFEMEPISVHWNVWNAGAKAAYSWHF